MTTTPVTDAVHVLEAMQADVRAVNEANGWFDTDSSLGERMSLLHSEVSESLEAYRRWGLDDATLAECKVRTDNGWHDEDTHLCKPEGVGPEFADVLIRLVDATERHDVPLVYFPLAVPEEYGPTEAGDPDRFGDTLDLLHRAISKASAEPTGERFAIVYATLVAAADRFGIDLDREYERKLAHNRTRGYRHGNKRL